MSLRPAKADPQPGPQGIDHDLRATEAGTCLELVFASPGSLPIGAKVQFLLAMELKRLCAAPAESAETATAIIVIKRMAAADRIALETPRQPRPIVTIGGETGTAFVVAGTGEV